MSAVTEKEIGFQKKEAVSLVAFSPKINGEVYTWMGGTSARVTKFLNISSYIMHNVLRSHSETMPFLNCISGFFLYRKIYGLTTNSMGHFTLYCYYTAA